MTSNQSANFHYLWVVWFTSDQSNKKNFFDYCKMQLLVIKQSITRKKTLGSPLLVDYCLPPLEYDLGSVIGLNEKSLP